MRYVIGIDEVGRAKAALAARPSSRIRKRTSQNSIRGFVIGVDEVGRGALAGPVTVCAALVPAQFSFRWPGAPSVLKDSKQLSPAAREVWVVHLRTCTHVAWAVASISAQVVDRIGIRNATNQAATRALRKLGARVRLGGCRLVLDAGLTIVPAVARELGIHSVACFPKADERVPAVAVASILAKVHRDAYMRRLHWLVPGYGFAAHNGYGTKAHRAAIRRRGPSAIHRLTFLHKHVTLKKSSKS